MVKSIWVSNQAPHKTRFTPPAPEYADLWSEFVSAPEAKSAVAPAVQAGEDGSQPIPALQLRRPGLQAESRESPTNYADMKWKAEQLIVFHSLEFTGGNITKAAKLLGVERRNFKRIMRRLGVFAQRGQG